MKFLILIVAAGLLYMLFKGDQKKKNLDQSAGAEKLKETGELVKDPICGSFVSADGGIRVRDGEKVHVFCSYECRDKFLKQRDVSAANTAQPEKEAAAQEDAQKESGDDQGKIAQDKAKEEA